MRKNWSPAKGFWRCCREHDQTYPLCNDSRMRLYRVSVGFVYHLHEILARQAFHYDDLLVELTEKLYRGCTEISWFRLCASSDVKSYLRT
jgi:hypothetical protein